MEIPKSIDIINAIVVSRMKNFKEKNGKWVARGDNKGEYGGEDSYEGDGDEGDGGQKCMDSGDDNQPRVNEVVNVPQITIGARLDSLEGRMT